jgi:hypothetical protein
LTWRAKLSVGGLVGLLFIAPIVILDGWLLNLLFVYSIGAQQINFGTFLIGLVVLLSVPVLLVLAYQTVSCLTLRYRLDRNGVAIRWFGAELILPIRDIQRIVPGYQLGSALIRRHGLRWPGHERGIGWVPGVGRARFLATRPVAEQLLLVTPGRAFAISPDDPEGVTCAFEARQELGPNRLLEREVRRARWFAWPFWTDRTARTLLGAALVVNLGLFAVLCARFPGLDFNLPLHFNSLGQVDRPGTKMELFALPIIGLLILVANLGLGLVLYRRERAGSYLLWGAAAAVQVLFWLAAFSIVP